MDDAEHEELKQEIIQSVLTRPNLVVEIQSGDRRRSLVAIRDYLAHELEGNRCKKCAMSELRTGDTAALVLRLTKVIEEIAALPPEQVAKPEGVIDLDSIRDRRPHSRETEAEQVVAAEFGSKRAPRRQGGRKPRSGGS